MSPNQKTILITGVSRGLGRAMTEEFIRLGHTVLGCGRSEKEIAQLQKQFPPPNVFATIDVSSDEQVAAWAKRALKSHAAPDLLLNNAGLINRNARLRVIRDGLVVHEGTIDSLKRIKDDIREARAGQDCGIKVHGFNDIKVGDRLEAFETVEVQRKL